MPENLTYNGQYWREQFLKKEFPVLLTELKNKFSSQNTIENIAAALAVSFGRIVSLAGQKLALADGIKNGAYDLYAPKFGSTFEAVQKKFEELMHEMIHRIDDQIEKDAIQQKIFQVSWQLQEKLQETIAIEQKQSEYVA